MKMAQVLCPGCDKPFSQKGLGGHLRKTQNVRCRTVRGTLEPPGSFPATASSLASNPNILSFLSPDKFLDFRANQWPPAKMEFLPRTQEGKFTATRVSSLTSLLILYISGWANDTVSSGGPYAEPDPDPDAEMPEIDPNAMEAVVGDAFQGDAMESDDDTTQSDASEANVIGLDAFGGDGHDFEDAFERVLDVFEHALLYDEVFETESQGKNFLALETCTIIY